MIRVTDLDSYLASFDGEPGYLDWAAFGPLSPAVRSEAQGDTELLGSGRRTSIDLVADHVREARELVAELIGTDASHVALQPSTTYGLMHAIYGLAGGLMLGRGEFPSLTVAATRASEAFGSVQLQWVEPADGFMTPDAIRSALSDDTRAVAVSLVDFRTGYRADLSAIREVIGDRLLIVDAIQGFGMVEADYLAADVVCGHGYKWLRAGRGTGFSWFGERALERIAPVLSGFTGVDGDLPVDAVPPPAASAQAFSVSGIDTLAAARLATALREVVDVGVADIESVLSERAADVMFFADRYEVPVVTPRQPERRAGIVTLEPAAQDAAPLAASLANHGLTVTARAGRIRVSPHVGTGADTLRLFGDALAAFSSSRVW
ncbi:aminotransferase class V-fold PLP-dependent enzyme [Microbacterium trichothecenolyticum]|uniref:Aminotransferase class V-fold PLP-dependent enzyme n=1 Tax=Microbacterium ureisolvens TaxID=2781186 RepID=A0ABS7HZL3_9MICO|nr:MULTISPECIES: aminotransferase class V-fold PLP-dependent enzyme [Microbacterium]MBW9110832.1 aminotransferase class V-fold PLP-dependent enzyme [Microbacterium ureisolvens]MBW9120983.1 aminotransferase class V-fold PLP-dependent enzyme [Microbacterium trichothecenolyticum]